ncbi:hypothetical protein FHX74_003727 [Friedmanniella endophytica]|uniref:Uncharacterized protein n=1 Tax=Microlunatus kandeliicorticis TaxID=1759536 RepID=A0A7W3IVM1_9ACTN|nr:hypothetical protein [Microlunatus kandeliicorticis]MBA8796086.1 hypothetical protein [Microlunatus kandeliicorticis]
MPTTPLIPERGPDGWRFSLGDGEALVAADGCAATHPDRPDHRYDAGGGTPRLVVDGVERTCRLERHGADLDEVDLTWVVDGLPALRLLVRHSVGGTWLQRYTLDHAGPEPLVVDRLTVGPEPRGDSGSAAVWALAAGAEAFWLTQPADGAGPVLAAVLQHGEVDGFGPQGWRTGPVRLEPGGRFVLQWQLDWSASAGVFERRRASVLPARTIFPEHEPCEIAGTDAAVVAADVAVGTEGEVTVLQGDRGTHRVELRAARGTVRFAVSWVRPVGDWVRAAGERWLTGDRTPSGVVRLPGAAAALVLQADHGRLADPDGPAAEALQRLTARLLDRDPGPEPDAFELALLAGEALRTGDPDCATAARAGVLAAERPVPGLGLATTRVGLAALAAGRPIGDLVDHVGRLAVDPTGPSPDPSDATERAGVVAARLELVLISRRQAARVGDDLIGLVRELGTAVGGGLPGGPPVPWPADRLAHVAAVLGMVPEAGAGGLTRWCLLGPQALADQVRRRALAALDAPPAGAEPPDAVLAPTLAWLVLGQPPV